VDVHSQLWMSANYKFDFGKRSQLIFDGSLRTADLVSQWKQEIIRFNYLCRANKFQVGGGFLFSNAYNYNSPPVATKEYRPFLHLSKRVGIINLRARWETRLFDTGNDLSVYNRFRLQARYSIPLVTEISTNIDLSDKEVKREVWSLVFSEELMYQSREFKCFGFDQNRAYAGIKWQGKKIALEPGYAGQIIRKSAGKYEWDNMFMLMFSGN